MEECMARTEKHETGVEIVIAWGKNIRYFFGGTYGTEGTAGKK
jgi:hypothetical protein